MTRLLLGCWYDAARRELEHGLAIDLEGEPDAVTAKTTSPVLAVVLGAGLPVLALGLYLFLGSPTIPEPLGVPAMSDLNEQDALPDVDAMLAQLKARLVEEPDLLRSSGRPETGHAVECILPSVAPQFRSR